MLNVLIDAYAVSPSWGSEPGMGWNWVSNLARYCNLCVITEGEWQKEIETAMDAAMRGDMDKSVNPTGLMREQAERMHFYYLNVSAEVRTMCWNQGSWKFYLYYEQWERRAYALAQQLIGDFKGTDHNIDLVHKLNMIGFREPGYLWKITDLPFVWGPVGGYGNVPQAFMLDASLALRLKSVLKTVINYVSIRWQPRVRKAARRADAMAGAYKETYEMLHKLYGDKVVLINETGTLADEHAVAHSSDREELQLLWVGKYDLRKQLGIALQTMARLKQRPNIHLYVLGTGYDADVKRYTDMVKQLGLSATVHLMGTIPNVQTREWMHRADLLFFTSIHDATSTVVPEAISAGLPVVCHNTRGFGDLVDDSIGRKVEVVSPEHSAAEFARIIEALDADRALVRTLSEGCLRRRHDISWEANARRMVLQYEKAIAAFRTRK